MFEDKKEHESYGLLEISRTTSSKGQNLFGSSIKHNNTIRLRIHPASLCRELNKDWYHAERIPYIEIEMSNTQFAEAITSLNMGSGVPCTIKHLSGKQMEDCPQESKRQQFENEFESDMVEVSKKCNSLLKYAKDLLNNKKAVSKSEKEELVNLIEMLKQHIGSNMPFVQRQFNEQMDKTVLEAKGEVEGFILNKVNSLGLEELHKQNRLLELND